MMAEFPALPLWTDAYLADTTHLDHAEHGRYLIMIIHIWRMPNRRFPNDDAWLARKFATSENSIGSLYRPLITEFFQCDGNWIWHKRIDREFARLCATSKRQSERARKGVSSKALGLKQCSAHSGLAAPAIQPQPQPQPQPDPDPRKKDSRFSDENLLSSRDDSRPKVDVDMNFAIDSYNVQAARLGLPRCSILNDKRRTALRKRLKEIGGNKVWDEAMLKVAETPFLTGNNSRRWVANIDFFLRPNSIPRLLEGGYNGTNGQDDDVRVIVHTHNHNSVRQSKTEAMRQMWKRELEKEQGNGSFYEDNCEEGTDGVPPVIPRLQAAR